MSESENKMKVVFVPGCFDSFEGTQEELDQLIADITAAAESGEIFQMSQPLTEEEFDLLPEEEKLRLLQAFADMDELEEFEDLAPTRQLH